MLIFWARDSRFHMEVCKECLNKVQTYKKFLISTNVQSTQTSAILELQTSDFAKIKKCKIQKSKNEKI